jgi:hypothetical protein
VTNYIPPTCGCGREKLYLAVSSLAAGTGCIRERLESAVEGFNRAAVTSRMASGRSATQLEAIFQELTRTPAQGSESGIKATLRMMTDEECSKLAQRIFSLYIELRGGI